MTNTLREQCNGTNFQIIYVLKLNHFIHFVTGLNAERRDPRNTIGSYERLLHK